MKFKKLGSSDVLVSEVCLGTMTFGSYNDEAVSHAQLDAYMEKVSKGNGGDFSKGLGFIDTAELYPVPPKAETSGSTEVIIGNWIEKHPELREKYVLATKVCGPWADRNFIAVERERALGVQDPENAAPKEVMIVPEQIEKALKASLKRLKTDYIDLYQLHWPDRPIPKFGSMIFTEEMKNEKGRADRGQPVVDEIVKCIGKLISEGKIKAWGLSNETPFGVCIFCESCEKNNVPYPVTVQQDFSLLDRRYEEGLLEVCAHFNIDLISYGSLAGGVLTGKYFDDIILKEKKVIPSTFESRHIGTPKFQPRYYVEDRSRKVAEKYCKLALENGLTPTELALGWCYSRWYLASVIIGATSVEQMNQCVDACEVELSEQIIEKIEEIHLENPNPNRTT